jgi:hypothetical protein
MFMVLENEFADGELWMLRELLEMLDEKIADIDLLIKKSPDPDSEGLCDGGEYFIGVGFVAIQQYLIDTLLFTGLDKKDAYELGSVHFSGETYVNLINSCANWWKHEAEWWSNGDVPKNGIRSFERVANVSDSSSYQLSNVLASICGSNKICLSSIVPYLEEWQAKVHENRKK